jgi:hypothetical protein
MFISTSNEINLISDSTVYMKADTFLKILLLLRKYVNTSQLRQRALTDLYLTRLSCGRMIWLLAHPLPPSPVSRLSLFFGLPVYCWSSLLTEESGGGGE